MPANEDAKKNPESESSKTAALSAEDRRAITEGLFEASVAQSLTDAGLESQRKRRNLRGAAGLQRRAVTEFAAAEPTKQAAEPTKEAADDAAKSDDK